MGFRGSPTGELVFEDCSVPAENLVGAENGGVSSPCPASTSSGRSPAVMCLGITRRALELALDHAKTRQQFGKPIAAFQRVQAKLANMYTPVESAKCLAYKAAAMCEGLEAGEPCARRGGPDPRRLRLHARYGDQPPLPHRTGA